MSLTVSEFNQVELTKNNNDDTINAIARIFSDLIRNDRGIINDQSIAPTLWEQKWINMKGTDISSEYTYNTGDAVWLNTDTPEQVLASRYNTILKYVQENGQLSKKFNEINPSDQQKINEFLINVIQGTVTGLGKQYRLYYVGDLKEKVQIRVSLKDDNSSFPDNDDYWKDFYIDNSPERNKEILLSTLSSHLDDMIKDHLSSYHLSSMTQQMFDMYVKKDLSADISSVNTQHFYDHNYCYEMEGFDYVISSEYKKLTPNGNGVTSQWYRLWKSGYLEHGGTIQCIAGEEDTLTTINFRNSIANAPIYNYPSSVNPYEYGFGKINISPNGNSVSMGVSSKNRYMITVTPMLDDENGKPYKESYQEGSPYKNKIYQCVDVTNVNNDGFSFFKSSKDQSTNHYSYYTCGYTTNNVK